MMYNQEIQEKEKRSLASLLVGDALRNTDSHIDALNYKTHVFDEDKVNNSFAGRYNPKKNQWGDVFHSEAEVSKFMKDRHKLMSEEEIAEEQNAIDNVGYLDIIYYICPNAELTEYKSRPLVVYPKDFRCGENNSDIYGLPISGNHPDMPGYKPKNPYFWKKLPDNIDEEGLLQGDLYINIGIIRNNILKGTPRYMVKRNLILNVKGHATEDVETLIKEVEFNAEKKKLGIF